MQLNLKTRETKIKLKTRLFTAKHKEKSYLFIYFILYEDAK